MSLAPGYRPPAKIDVWPRGGAKSTSAQIGSVLVGTSVVEHEGARRPMRRFVLYVSRTQSQADDHVQAIADKLEVLGIGRATNKYNASKGWRLGRVRADNGFNVVALGMDAAVRGIKLDDYRPDLIILDDIDDRLDSDETIDKKKKTITDSILPSGSSDCAILVIQNKIHADSIVSQLLDGRADFLLNRETPLEEPALIGIEYEVVEDEKGKRSYKITAGEPTWLGQDRNRCEQQMNDWGKAAFLREAQHDTDESDEGLWQQDWIDRYRISRVKLPHMERVVVGIDPSGGSGQCGIVCKGKTGRGENAHYYVLEDATPEAGTSPGGWADEALECYVRNQADAFAVETNFGGQMAETILRQAAERDGVPIRVITVVASRGKQVRAEPIAELAEKGYEHHVGHWPELEKEKKKWKPGDKSPNRLDADVWANTELMTDTDVLPPRRSTVRQTWI